MTIDFSDIPSKIMAPLVVVLILAMVAHWDTTRAQLARHDTDIQATSEKVEAVAKFVEVSKVKHSGEIEALKNAGGAVIRVEEQVKAMDQRLSRIEQSLSRIEGRRE